MRERRWPGRLPADVPDDELVALMARADIAGVCSDEALRERSLDQAFTAGWGPRSSSTAWPNHPNRASGFRAG